MRYGKGNVQNELGKNTNYLLYQLGLTANYRGFFYVSYAIELSTEKEERLLLVTKRKLNKVAAADSGEDGIRVNGFLIHLSAEEECVRHEIIHNSWVALGVAVESGECGGVNDGLGAAGHFR